MFRILRFALTNSTIAGTLVILLFTGGLSTIIFFLSWLVYRDRYGISVADYFRIFF